MITYFSARQQVLNVAGAAASIAWTPIDISAFVPVGTSAVIAIIEAEDNATAAAMLDMGTFDVRKDAASGICATQKVLKNVSAVGGDFESVIIPISPTRTFEYDFVMLAGADNYDLRIWLIGYIK
jgi:hypothetical protein